MGSPLRIVPKGENMKEQSFCMVTDFLELDEQAFQRMLPDLIEWHRLTRKSFSTLKGLGYIAETAKVNVGDFIWIDDGKPGNREGVSLKIQGK